MLSYFFLNREELNKSKHDYLLWYRDDAGTFRFPKAVRFSIDCSSQLGEDGGEVIKFFWKPVVLRRQDWNKALSGDHSIIWEGWWKRGAVSREVWHVFYPPVGVGWWCWHTALVDGRRQGWTCASVTWCWCDRLVSWLGIQEFKFLTCYTVQYFKGHAIFKFSGKIRSKSIFLVQFA